MYNYTVYAYWNQDQLFNLFNAVVIIMGGGDWLLLMKSIAIVGLIAAAGGALARGRGENFATYFIFTAIMYGAVMLPKTDVVIEDVTGHNAPMVVSNVPWGVGALSSITSHIGYWLTKGYETALAIPGDIAFQKNGFLFGAKLLTAKQNTTIRDPQLRTDMLNWYQECIAYEIAGDPVMQDVIKNSNDIWTDSSAIMNQGRVVSIYHAGTGQTSAVNCKTAYDELGPRLTADKNNNVIPMLGAYLFANDPVATAGTQTSMDVAELTMLNVAATGADTIKQAMLLNLFREGPANIAAVTNNPAMAAIEMAKVQAAAQANAGYETGRALSESALPLIRNAIHTLIIGVFPIVLLLILVSGDKGITILASYVSMLVFVELWAPLFAIVNHLLTYASMKDTASIVQNTGGVTLETYDMVSKGLITAQGVAGMLTLSIPVMAYMIVSKSQNAAANIASGVMQPSQSASQSAGSNAAMGNLSGGNVQWTNSSMHNGSMNQWNDAPTAKTGAGVMTQTGSDGSSISTMADGSQILNRSATQGNLGAYEVSLSSGTLNNVQKQSTDASSASITNATQAGQSFNAGLASAKEYASSFSSSNGIGVRTGSANDVKLGKAIAGLEQAGQDFAKDSGLSQSQASSIASSINASVPLPVISASLKQEGISGARLDTAMRAAEKYSSSQQVKDDISTVKGYSTSIDTTNGSEQQNRAAQSMRANFEQAKSASETSSKQLAKSEAYSEAANNIVSGGAAVQASLNNAWVSSKGGAESANDFIRNHSDAEIIQDLNQFSESKAAAMAVLGDKHFNDMSDSNANVKQATAGFNLPDNQRELDGDYNKAAAGVKSQSQDNKGHVGGNAHAQPTAQNQNAIPGEKSITITPDMVQDVYRSERSGTQSKIHTDGENIKSYNSKHGDDISGGIDHAANTPGYLTGTAAENTVGKGTLPGGAVKAVADTIPTATPEQIEAVKKGGDYTKVPNNPNSDEDDLIGG